MSKKKAPSKKPSPAKTPSADSKRLVGRLAQIGLFLVVIEGNRLLKWVGAKPRLALTIGMNVVRTMSERLRQTTQELTRFHSLVESFLAAKTKEEVVEGLAQELQRIVTPEVASGAMVYAYNPFIEEFASLKHWGQVPGDLLMSRKELPHDSPQCRRFPLGLSEKDGCLVLIDPRERHLLKKIPVIQTFAWIAYQTLKNVEARLEEELKSRMKSTSISS
ncbi:MAG: hypothetical protein HYT79_08040 [Elusimicrobia bacterium]|nr:hypothetical protein [Elusimicrobiota bacterium]